MLECMKSLGKRNKIYSYNDSDDETYALFKSVLIEYLPFIDEEEALEVNEEHKEYFKALDELYSISKSNPADDWNQEERMADSLAWYKASGLITMKNGNYYINAERLKQKLIEYQEYNSKVKNLHL